MFLPPKSILLAMGFLLMLGVGFGWEFLPRMVTQTSTLTATFTTTTYSTTTVAVTVPQIPPCGPAAAQPSEPKPSTVGFTGEPDATNSSSQRKVLTGAGLVWVFYTDSANLLYQTSGDGKNWSAPMMARAKIDRGWFFTIAQNGTTLYLVASASDGSTGGNVTFREGTLFGNGTIGWITAEQAIPYSGTDPTVPTVAVDTAGSIWVAIEDYSPYQTSFTNRSVAVFKSVSGTWSQVLTLVGLKSYPKPILLALTSGKMALEILTETPGDRKVVVYTTANGGAGWSSQVATPRDNILTLSAVSVGDAVYSVTTNTSGSVSLWKFTYGGSSFVGPTDLTPSCSVGYFDAVISTDGSSTLTVAFSTLNFVVCESSKDLGSTWTQPASLASREIGVQPGTLAASYLTGDLVCVAWTAQNQYDTPQPYGVRSATLDLPAGV
jgi:hypothetical protein